jgi:hypothetical protein
MIMKKDENKYVVIGGQYDRYNYGSAATLTGAMRIASKHVENWDNWQGPHVPVIYRMEDCEMAENFFGPQMLPKSDATPVARKENGTWMKGEKN